MKKLFGTDLARWTKTGETETAANMPKVKRGGGIFGKTKNQPPRYLQAKINEANTHFI